MRLMVQCVVGLCRARKRQGLLSRTKAAQEERAAQCASGSLWNQLVPAQASTETDAAPSFSFAFG